jgi:hypothetical protein
MSISAEFWGKARPDSDGVASFHPLPAHSLDVAAVAVLLLGGRILSMDPRMLGFLVSVHDIGKFSRPFPASSFRHPISTLRSPSGVLSPQARASVEYIEVHILSNPLGFQQWTCGTYLLPICVA